MYFSKISYITNTPNRINSMIKYRRYRGIPIGFSSKRGNIVGSYMNYPNSFVPFKNSDLARKPRSSTISPTHHLVSDVLKVLNMPPRLRRSIEGLYSLSNNRQVEYWLDGVFKAAHKVQRFKNI